MTTKRKPTTVGSQFVGALAPKPTTTLPLWADGLKQETVTQIKSHVKQVLQFGESIKKGYIGVGQELAAIKELVEPVKEGGFKALVEQEFSMSEQLAYGLINVCKQFAELDETAKSAFSLLGQTVQLRISAPSVPEEAKEAILEVAQETGKSPTEAQAKETISIAKETRKQTGKPASKESLKRSATTKNTHGNSSKEKKPREKQPAKAPTIHRPSDKFYSSASNTVWLEHLTNELRQGTEDITACMRNDYLKGSDLADVLVFRDAAAPFWSVVERLVAVLEKQQKGLQQPTS